MGNLLDRRKLLEREELERVKVEFEDGNYVFVRQMTGRERDNFEQSLIKETKDAKGVVVSYDRALGDFRAKLAVVTVCNEAGDMIFLPDDYGTLSKHMSAKKLELIVNKAQELNKITEEDKEAIVKNSVVGQADNSNSDSVENLDTVIPTIS